MVSFLSVNLKGSRTIAPRKIALNLKTNPNQNPNANRGQFSSAAIAWLPPNAKTNPNLDPNPNPNWGAIFLVGRQLPGYQFKDMAKL